MKDSVAGITIRAATNRDVERVRTLVYAALKEYGLKPDPDLTDADISDIEGNFLKRGGLFEVIEDEEGNLLGTVGLYRMDDATCELRKMYFAPSLRGRGWGLHILERMVAAARERGFKRMTLETSSVLERAISLYTRFGFQPYDEIKHRSIRSDLAYFLNL